MGPDKRAQAAGYPTTATVAENLVFGAPATPLFLFEAWRGSPGHNDNMLNPIWVTSGLGMATGQGGAYATQLFGNAQPGESTPPNPGSEACDQATAARDALKEAVAKQRKRVANANTKAKKKRARRKLRRLRSQLADAEMTRELACG